MCCITSRDMLSSTRGGGGEGLAVWGSYDEIVREVTTTNQRDPTENTASFDTVLVHLTPFVPAFSLFFKNVESSDSMKSGFILVIVK